VNPSFFRFYWREMMERKAALAAVHMLVAGEAFVTIP